MIGRPGAAYTFIHVADVVRAIEAAIDRAPGGVFFLGRQPPVTAMDVLRTIERAVGRRARFIRVPSTVIRAGAALGAAAGRVTGQPALLNLERAAELFAEGFVCSVDAARDRYTAANLGFVATRLGALVAAGAAAGSPLVLWEPTIQPERYLRDALRSVLIRDVKRATDKPPTRDDLVADFHVTLGWLDVAHGRLGEARLEAELARVKEPESSAVRELWAELEAAIASSGRAPHLGHAAE